jgi:hypothetical protein
MTGKPARGGQLHHRDLAVEIGIDDLLDAALLPNSQGAARRPVSKFQAAERLDDMCNNGSRRVIDKELVDLIGTIKSGKQRVAQGCHDFVGYANSWRKVEIANLAAVGIIGAGVQTTTRNIEV